MSIEKLSSLPQIYTKNIYKKNKTINDSIYLFDKLKYNNRYAQ